MSKNSIDAIMCLLWMLTYTLVLVGTEKYKYPLISPVTQLAIAPFEFSVLYKLIAENAIRINYISISYLYWAIIEIAIVVSLIRHVFVLRRYALVYVLLMSAITAIMCYVVAYKDQQFFFSYFNTFVGEIAWLWHFKKNEYPIKPIVLLIFCTKFVGDAISIPVYYGSGSWATDLICILLPILDFLFIHVYFQRKIKNKCN